MCRKFWLGFDCICGSLWQPIPWCKRKPRSSANFEMRNALEESRKAQASKYLTSQQQAVFSARARQTTEDVLRRIRVCQATREVILRRGGGARK